MRSKNGLRTLLGLLESRPSASLSHPTSLLKMQTLTAQVLLGLAQDADICHNLSKLQVGYPHGTEKLATSFLTAETNGLSHDVGAQSDDVNWEVRGVI